MRKLIFLAILWYIRRSGGSIEGWAQPRHTKLRHKRRFYIVAMTEFNYTGLRNNTTWTRGVGL
jgi:hypothetical protein